MSERPPKPIKVAWMENGSPQKRSSPPEPYKKCMVQPMQIKASPAASSWMDLCNKEEKSMQVIQTFLEGSRKEEAMRMQFLETICTLCEAARCKGLSQALNDFCHRFKLAENIKVLLEEEPTDHLHTAVRQQAMRAITTLSQVEMVLEGKKESLLQACFSSVFLLPPKSDMQGLSLALYFKTLDTMDIMLQTLVISSRASMFKELQRVLQMLLTFTNSQNTAVCERAVGRIKSLSDLMASSSSVEVQSSSVGGSERPVCHTQCHIPILGQLLGRLIVCCTCKDLEIRNEALDALVYLFRFILQQKCTMLSEDNPDHPQHLMQWELENISWPALPSSSNITMAFGKILQPSERADIIIMAIKAMGDSSNYDKEEVGSILDVAIREPSSWLTEVPKMVRCIYENIENDCMATVHDSLDLLLLLMTDEYPREVVTSLLKLSPSCDSVALAMWDVMLSQPYTLEKVLRELLSKLQDQRLRRIFKSITEDACIHHLALLASNDTKSEDFADLYKFQRYLRQPSLELLSLVLRGLVTLSNRPEKARKMFILLPDIMEIQQNASTDNKMKALLVFRNVMGHMKRVKASPTTLQLVEKLLPLFDEDSTQLRKFSIILFKDVMQLDMRNGKKLMKKTVKRSLLPLYFHMSDEVESVAKASQETFLVAAKLLKWKQLKHLIQTEQMHKIGECLLMDDRDRIEEYLSQSLPYLKGPQVTLCEEAVRFIGLAARHLSGLRKEQLHEIYRTLQTLEKDDEVSVSSLASQTLLVLSKTNQQQTSRCSLWTLFCWPCKAMALIY